MGKKKEVVTCLCSGFGLDRSYTLLHGYNSEPHSDEFLFQLLEYSNRNERFEDSVVYRDELIKRGLLEPVKEI